jgi:hypothetical protein
MAYLNLSSLKKKVKVMKAQAVFRFASLVTFTVISILLHAEDPIQRSLYATKIAKDLVIDGSLDETEWTEAETATNFWLNFPMDSIHAAHQTFARILYNEEYLYISAEIRQSKGSYQKYVASSLKRDFPFLENDAFGMVIDPFNDRTNGYGFYVSAYGVQRDEQIFSGTTADATWDIKWTSAVKHDDEGWTVEMAIPLRYLRFKEDVLGWNINFLRNDVIHNESSSWAATPRYFSLGNLAFSGKLNWQEKLVKASKNISIIPNITFRAGQDKTQDITTQIQPSLDAKITVTPSLNLDATINPDFSQVEVDQAQINLTRFELVFPEKRLFFVENSDLFSQFGVEKWGTSPIRPFYSRRIGLHYNKRSGLYEQSRILGGLRLSGKLTKDLRIGIMNTQTSQESLTVDEQTKQKFYPGQNYTAFALQQKTFSRSNIGFIFSQRQAMGSDSTSDYSINKNDFSRLAGVDYNLASVNGKWTGKLFHHMLFEKNVKSSAQGGLLQYTTKRTLSWVGVTKADPQFQPDAGFVPRAGFFNVYGELSYFLYPKKNKVNFIQPVLHYTLYLDSLAKVKTDQRIITGAQWRWHNTAYLYLLLFKDYTRLTTDFNPSRKEDALTLPAGTDYDYTYLRIYYVSDLRKKFSWHVYTDIGQFYNGNILMLSGYFNRKIQPWGLIGIDYNATFIQMPKPYENNKLYLIGPKADISLSKSLFLNTVVQYNTQSQNLNFYGKIQWRYKPLSDVFLVYTNNKSTNPWERQNQNLVLKVVWWL